MIYVGYLGEVLYQERGEGLEQAAQRGGGCPIPGDIQDQARPQSEQPDLAVCALFIVEELD